MILEWVAVSDIDRIMEVRLVSSEHPYPHNSSQTDRVLISAEMFDEEAIRAVCAKKILEISGSAEPLLWGASAFAIPFHSDSCSGLEAV